jgi:hypothetical protein
MVNGRGSSLASVPGKAAPQKLSIWAVLPAASLTTPLRRAPMPERAATPKARLCPRGRTPATRHFGAIPDELRIFIVEANAKSGRTSGDIQAPASLG